MAKKELNKKDYEKYSLKGSCLWGILIFFLLIAIDLVTKMVAEVYFTSEGAKKSIDIIPGWIALTFAQNRGISYGLGSDAKEWVKIAVIAATFVLMLLLTVLYFKLDKRRSFMRIAIVFVVAGGIGNFIDRVYYQVWDPATFPSGVRDMVDLSRFGFAVCNFADFFISIGAVMLVFAILFFDKDALFPLTKKYKALRKESDEAEKAKEEEKQARKQAKKAAKGK
ncbi:MAG: signal peptidase II [Clostridia bacterium]|nr:signal peptidase II [Clostridia bacterium]